MEIFSASSSRGWVRSSPAAMEKVDWFYASDTYAIRLVFIITVCTAIWVLVTWLTPPV